jgi:transposase
MLKDWPGFDVQEMQEIDGLIRMTECPRCGKSSIAVIFWGYPADVDEYLKAIDDKEIVAGGCLVSNNDPKWECTDCYCRWGIRDEDEDE